MKITRKERIQAKAKETVLDTHSRKLKKLSASMADLEDKLNKRLEKLEEKDRP